MRPEGTNQNWKSNVTLPNRKTSVIARTNLPLGLYDRKQGMASPGALPLPYVPARVTCGALVAHGHSFAPPRCRTSQYSRSLVPLCVSLERY